MSSVEDTQTQTNFLITFLQFPDISPDWVCIKINLAWRWYQPVLSSRNRIPDYSNHLVNKSPNANEISCKQNLIRIGVGGVFFEVAEPRSAEHGSFPLSCFYLKVLNLINQFIWLQQQEQLCHFWSPTPSESFLSCVSWLTTFAACISWLTTCPFAFPFSRHLLNVATPYFVFLIFPQILHVHTVTCFDMAVSDWAFDSSVSSVQSDTTFAFATTS